MSSPIHSDVSPPPLPPPTPAPPYIRPPKNPWVALVLSFVFPGIGQVYNGQPAKALVFFFAFTACIYSTVHIDPMPFALMIPFVYFFNLVDAYRSADIINARFRGGLKEPEETVESPAWGATLILLGLLLLMNNLGVLRLAAVKQYWPLLLVLVGGVLFYSAFRRQKRRDSGNGGV